MPASPTSPPTTRRRSRSRSTSPARRAGARSPSRSRKTTTTATTTTATAKVTAASPSPAPAKKTVEETAEYLTPLQATVYTAAISLLAVPTLYVLDATQAAVETETVLMLTGVVICALVAYLSYRVVFARLPPAARSDVYLPLFSLFAFTCIVDLMLALNVYGVVDCINWYLSHGEVYLNTNYGSAINFWDGIAHWALYIAMVWVLCHAHSSKTVAAGRPLFLYWVGSIMYCLVIFLPGATIGQHSSQLKLSSLLNMPYVFLPVSFCVRVLNSPRPRDRRHTPEYSTVLDAVLAIYFLFATAVAFLRFNACLGSEWPPAVFWAKEVEPLLDDPGRAFKLQGVISFYYMTPLYIYALYYLIVGGQSPAMEDVAAIHAGGSGQTQFSYMLCAVHFMTAPQLLPTAEHSDLFWVTNILLFIMPHLFLWRCMQSHHFSGLLGCFPCMSSGKK